LKELLKPKIIKEFYICQEIHRDGNFHLHCYIQLDFIINLTNPNRLDLLNMVTKKVIHGNYQAVRNKDSVIHYLQKNKGPSSLEIFYLEPSKISIKESRKQSIKEAKELQKEDEKKLQLELKQITDEKGFTQALRVFAEKKPELVATKYTSVYNNLKKYSEMKPTTVSPKFTADSFVYPTSLLEWFNNYKNSHTLVLESASGFGKTQGIISLLTANGYTSILRINDINKLTDLRTEHTALILDDLAWDETSRETKINLFDKDSISNIRVLYGTVDIPPDILKIVLTNNRMPIVCEWDPRMIDGIYGSWRYSEAIQRRVRIVTLEKTMIKPK
jgi:hypothetical protein